MGKVKVSPPVPRVVFDTNTVLSAVLFVNGRLAWLREHWRKDACTPLASAATVAELLRVVAYPKFKLSSREQEDVLSDYVLQVSTVVIPTPPPKVPKCRDVHDRMFLELAVVGNADMIVTGDKDLLALAEGFHIAVLTPEQYGLDFNQL